MVWKAYFEIIRPSGCIFISIIVLIGQILTLNCLPNVGIGFPAVLTSFLLTASSFTINDYYDYEIDKVNTPWRTLPSKKMDKNRAIQYGIFLAFIGLMFALFNTFYSSLVALGSYFISIIYIIKGKKFGFLGNLMVSFTIASSFIFGSLSVNNRINSLVLHISIISFFYILGGEIIQSISDAEGDKIADVKSIALVHGYKYASLLASVCYIITAFAGAYFAYYYSKNLETFSPFIILSTILILSYILIPLIKEPNKRTAKETRKKINYIAFLIIIVLLFYSCFR
ncbi:geranylgeranylglycerol-phosphate geranylgeranyltransferase [Candidatus Bathyarchaeota archaeon]|nr:geranylgeranylglycerol-phosphate geranylgeranyltransferase [Candidatus Bathyarchaeota archaeon]